MEAHHDKTNPRPTSRLSRRRKRKRIDLEPAMERLAKQAENLPPDRRDALLKVLRPDTTDEGIKE